jgi:translation initiation factor IF-2
MDVPVRSYLTLLTDDQVSRIRARWEREKRTRAEQAARAAAPTPPPRRRRTAEPVAAAAAAPAAEAGAPAAVRRRVRVADAEADGALNGSAHEDGEHQTAGDSAIAAHAEVPDLSVPTPVDTPQPERAAPEPEVTAPARPRWQEGQAGRGRPASGHRQHLAHAAGHARAGWSWRRSPRRARHPRGARGTARRERAA